MWSLLKVSKGRYNPSIVNPSIVNRQSSIRKGKAKRWWRGDDTEKRGRGWEWGRGGETKRGAKIGEKAKMGGGLMVGEGRASGENGRKGREKGVLVLGGGCRVAKHLFKVSGATRQREISPFSPLRVRCSTLRDDPYPPKNFWGGGHLTISKVRLLISPIPHTPYPYPLTPPARYGTPCWI